MTASVFILNGPNLDRLGRRQPEVYGTVTLADIEARCRARAEALGLSIAFHQSSHEGVLVELIHQADDAGAAIVINAGAYTHTSIAIHDALVPVETPVIEVHLSNIHAREDFRRHSYVSRAATGLICGLGAAGYELALEAVHRRLADAAA